MFPSSTLKSIWRGARPAYAPAIRSGACVDAVAGDEGPEYRDVGFFDGAVAGVERGPGTVVDRATGAVADCDVERPASGAALLEERPAAVEEGFGAPPDPAAMPWPGTVAPLPCTGVPLPCAGAWARPCWASAEARLAG